MLLRSHPHERDSESDFLGGSVVFHENRYGSHRIPEGISRHGMAGMRSTPGILKACKDNSFFWVCCQIRGPEKNRYVPDQKSS